MDDFSVCVCTVYKNNTQKGTSTSTTKMSNKVANLSKAAADKSRTLLVAAKEMNADDGTPLDYARVAAAIGALKAEQTIDPLAKHCAWS